MDVGIDLKVNVRLTTRKTFPSALVLKVGKFFLLWHEKAMNCEGWKRKSPVLSSPPALLDPNLLFCSYGWNHTCGILRFSLSRLCREGGICFVAEPVRMLFSRRLEFDWTPSHFVAAKIQKTKRLSSGQILVINKKLKISRFLLKRSE